jgi:outer membrane receptor protein involved in Fe transport
VRLPTREKRFRSRSAEKATSATTSHSIISFDFYGQYGEVDTEVGLADVLLSRYYQALDATTDASGIAVCRDPSGGCVPLSPFNHGASADARAFTDAGVEATVNLTQLLFGFSIQGEGRGLPAGELQYAAGVEYRRESSKNIPDELMQARDPVTGNGLGLIGLTSGPAPELNTVFLPIVGDYSVGEIFGELLIPVISDRAWLQSLELDVAARYSDYDVIDSSLSHKTGLNWILNDVFRFRATYSRAIRAPNIGELFSPAVSGSAFVTDPCDASNLNAGRNPANRQANCAALGLPPDFQSLAEFFPQTTTGQGNPDLTEESADTVTLGAIITIGSSFNVAIDYWDIEIEDAVVRFGPDQTLANCVDGAAADPVFCSFVTRASDGQIVNVDLKDINAGLFNGSGIDLESNYVLEFESGNTLNFNLIASYLDEITFLPNPADPVTLEKQADTLNRPRVRALFGTVFDSANWQLAWDMNYIGSSRFRRDVQPEELPFNKIDSKIYHALSVRYRFDDRLEVFGGVRNLTDEEPPILNNYGGVLYDAVGRYYFGGARFNYQ